MTEVVRKGILEAEIQLQKANEEKLMEEVCVCVRVYVHVCLHACVSVFAHVWSSLLKLV